MSIDRAMSEAAKSIMRHRHGAVIVDKRGRVLATGWNQLKTHPRQKAFSLSLFQEYTREHLHAEVHAIINCERLRLMDKAHKIYVARLTAVGTGLSRPCSICQEALDKTGIKLVEYTL